MAPFLSVHIRDETETDRHAVFGVHEAAFAGDAEARLVDVLRESVSEYISMVAVENQDIVGHIMFTLVTLEPFDHLKLMGLAPMSVAPSMQRGGIGTELIKAGLRRCRDLGVGAVAVLGHPEYYPRFGFAPAADWGIGSEYDVPENVFMMLELLPGYLQSCQGTIRYHSAFAGLSTEDPS